MAVIPAGVCTLGAFARAGAGSGAGVLFSAAIGRSAFPVIFSAVGADVVAGIAGSIRSITSLEIAAASAGAISRFASAGSAGDVCSVGGIPRTVATLRTAGAGSGSGGTSRCGASLGCGTEAGSRIVGRVVVSGVVEYGAIDVTSAGWENPGDEASDGATCVSFGPTAIWNSETESSRGGVCTGAGSGATIGNPNSAMSPALMSASAGSLELSEFVSSASESLAAVGSMTSPASTLRCCSRESKLPSPSGACVLAASAAPGAVGAVWFWGRDWPIAFMREFLFSAA